jgi:hypothetical protein
MTDDVASTFTGGVKPYRVVGWTNDGEIYCPACAADRGLVNEKPTDQLERDDGRPVFADSERDTRPTCGDCSGAFPYVTVLGGGSE